MKCIAFKRKQDVCKYKIKAKYITEYNKDDNTSTNSPSIFDIMRMRANSI